MKKFFVFLLFISLQQGISQPFVLIPDVSFRAYLQNTIPAAMVGHSLNTTHPLVINCAPTMSVSYRNIADLTGIQYFSSLVALFCDRNSITSLPALPNSLSFLECGNNKLTNLPALPNSLNHLGCGNNSLTSLPALPNSLTYLSCRNNPLANLPALPNSIQNIFCENNFLTTLPTLPTSLFALWCGNNSLTSLPALPNSLRQLLCYSNSLTSLPALPDSLNSLWCGFNNIICFPPLPNSLVQVLIDTNPYTCLPNFVLPAMNNYTNIPLCAPGNTNGCAVVGIKEIKSSDYQINIFPNPTSDILNIKTEGVIPRSIEIKNILGQTILSLNNIDQEITKINTKDFIHGYYFINVTIESKNISGHFIKN